MLSLRQFLRLRPYYLQDSGGYFYAGFVRYGLPVQYGNTAYTRHLVQAKGFWTYRGAHRELHNVVHRAHRSHFVAISLLSIIRQAVNQWRK